MKLSKSQQEALTKLYTKWPNFKPHKPYNKDYNVEELTGQFDVYRKYDGVRCLIVFGKVFTAALKPFKNPYVAEIIQSSFKSLNHIPLFEGEITTKVSGVRHVTKIVNKSHATLEDTVFNLIVFDYLQDRFEKYADRREFVNHSISYSTRIPMRFANNITISSVTPIHSSNYQDTLQLGVPPGWEGFILRNPDSRYKFGRATFKEQAFFKYVPWKYSSGKIVGIKMEVDADARGQNKAYRDLMTKQRAGSFIVKSPDFTKKVFSLGILGDATKLDAYENPVRYLGAQVEFKYKELGVDSPRSPIFVRLPLNPKGINPAYDNSQT